MKKKIYLAGGCFWGVEHTIALLRGVTDTTVGYANGHVENPTYHDVKYSETGHKETVEVIYDSDITPTSVVLKAFFLIIDPTRNDGQGADIGSQYRTAVYYPENDLELKSEIEAFFIKQKALYPRFYTELGPLKVFYDAEDYHQDYLVKNPSGYCHVSKKEFEQIRALN